MLTDTPTISACKYASATMGVDNFGLQNFSYSQAALKEAVNIARAFQGQQPVGPTNQQPKESTMPKRRIVQVFIADTDENIPLDQCLLYKGDQKLTDATDQELFFEIDIKSVIEAHNAKRVTLVDKKVKNRVEHLEPVKIRDLKMTVVTVAEFG
jgi:hypothetical protein